MDKARKMCFDKILPQDLRRPQRVMMTRDGRMRAIAPKDKRWVNGSNIRIRFLGGTAAQQNMVRSIAPQWTQFANLSFEFTTSPQAEIRVSFDPNDGAWSYVGTDNQHIPKPNATLNLGWQDEGVILHEFGHMIGLAHEHQNPAGGIQWNEAVVIRELGGPPNNWDEETVRHNVLEKYSADQIFGTVFDPDSIMLYSFPAEWTLNNIATHENSRLSAMDKDFIASAKMYPRAESPSDRAVPLDLGVPCEAEIGQAGEEDLYRFSADQSGEYVVKTTGGTDTVLSVYGPDSETRFVAEDDDTGYGRNAMVRAALSRGTYFVQVRHYSGQQTGAYRVVAELANV